MVASQEAGGARGAAEEDNAKDSTERIMEYQRREYAFLSQTARQEREMKGLRRKAGEAAYSFRDMQKDTLEDACVDPAVNMEIALLRQRLIEKDNEIAKLKDESQNSTFQPNSIQGKKLLNKCSHLLEENSELGRQLAEERMQSLRIQIAVQRRVRQQLKGRIGELDRHAEQVDGENEKMQQKIAELGKGLKAARAEIDSVKKDIEDYNLGGTKRKKEDEDAAPGTVPAPPLQTVPPPAIQPVPVPMPDGDGEKKKRKKEKKAKKEG
eukprot:TRINITY_DN21162_c0_g1_i1.p1 TRINITY_DN21162_c0_g1~~TRINITY_DN21162_c0_g1_i1.p1  ORF type:complete len:267 (+),score=94.42 TRINITY_DN21162_c0_g1_i1:95-895(+)